MRFTLGLHMCTTILHNYKPYSDYNEPRYDHIELSFNGMHSYLLHKCLWSKNENIS